jgi:putative MATE family efflux protein
MRDLTRGPIFRHLVELSVPIGIGMLLQTLYYLVDLYFVARLGDAPLAGVSAAANLMFLVFALTQMLAVGTTTLVSHAVGRKDQAEANHVFNQSVALSALLALATLAGGYALAGEYMQLMGPDAETRAAGVTYLYWFLPGLGLQYALATMSSGLRGTGIVKPGMVVQMATVVLNAILAPVLIAGWGTGHPLGVAGAGLASTIAIAVGVALLGAYFLKLEKYVHLHPRQWRPHVATWGRMLNIGIPAGGEFALIGLIVGVCYWIIRDFGAAAQAGFGIGSRLMQSIFLPAMAVAFAAPALAGQNFGARRFERVRETFSAAAWTNVAIMAAITVLCQWKADGLVRAFTDDDAVIRVGTGYLHIISWNFVAVGLVFTCSGLFQALGNTWPSLASKAVRLLTFVAPAIWLSARPGFELEDVWKLSVASQLLEALTSAWLLRREFARRLGPADAVVNPPDGIPAAKGRS